MEDSILGRSLSQAQVEAVLVEMERICHMGREPLDLVEEPTRLAVILAKQYCFRQLQDLLEEAWGSPLLEFREEKPEEAPKRLSVDEYLALDHVQ